MAKDSNWNWKNILIIWIATGVFVAGIFHIYPKQKYSELVLGSFDDYNYRDLILLITIVVAFLIWGLKMKKNE